MSNEVATSVLPTTPVKTRVRHNLDNKSFVEAYTAANSAKEVATALNVPVNIVNSRAAYLRKKGVELKHFDAKRSRIDVSALNALVTAPVTE